MPDFPAFQRGLPGPEAYAALCAKAADGMGQAGAFGDPEQWRFDWDRPSPKGPRINGELLAIECLARPDCWAVGDDEGASETLHWNGRHWSLVPSPDPGGDSFLFGVQCLGPADCLAVGFSHVPPTRNLALHWNGTKWVSV